MPVFSPLEIKDVENGSVGRFKTSYLADQIHAYFKGNISAPIAVTTFVNIDDLYQSSTFGRVLGEQLISELAMRGYSVVELRLADALQVMHNEGEFGLSRETPHLKNNQQIGAMVVGTYTVSPVRIYLNARIIDPSSSMVMSVGSVEMSKTKEIEQMLRSNSFPTALERIPVRHLGYSVYPAPYYWPSYGYTPPPYLAPVDESKGENEQPLPKTEGKKQAHQTPPRPTLEGGS